MGVYIYINNLCLEHFFAAAEEWLFSYKENLKFTFKTDLGRFQVRPITAAQMRVIATEVADSIRARIRAGKNVHDSAARSLTEAYMRRKLGKRGDDIRDWFWTGKVLGDIKVLRASDWRAIIGFADDFTNMVATVQNKKELAFGMSPSDMKVMNAAVAKALQNTRIVRLMQVARF